LIFFLHWCNKTNKTKIMGFIKLNLGTEEFLVLTEEIIYVVPRNKDENTVKLKNGYELYTSLSVDAVLELLKEDNK
jgi:hypothetical protein